MNGEYRVVYLTPEWCTTDYGKDILIKISKNLSLTLVAIDEAHCVSQWGFDFRTSYRLVFFLNISFFFNNKNVDTV